MKTLLLFLSLKILDTASINSLAVSLNGDQGINHGLLFDTILHYNEESDNSSELSKEKSFNDQIDFDFDNSFSENKFKRIESNYEQISISYDQDREPINNCIASCKEKLKKLDAFSAELFEELEINLKKLVFFLNENSNSNAGSDGEVLCSSINVSYFESISLSIRYIFEKKNNINFKESYIFTRESKQIEWPAIAIKKKCFRFGDYV